jgi:hypothetical protein
LLASPRRTHPSDTVIPPCWATYTQLLGCLFFSGFGAVLGVHFNLGLKAPTPTPLQTQTLKMLVPCRVAAYYRLPGSRVPSREVAVEMGLATAIPSYPRLLAVRPLCVTAGPGQASLQLQLHGKGLHSKVGAALALHITH